MALILAAGKFLKINSWIASLLVHGGIGIAFLFVTASGRGEEGFDDPVVVKGPPLMSIPLNTVEQVEPEEKEPEPTQEPKIITEEAEQPLCEPEPEEMKQEVSTVLSPPSFEGNIPPKYPRVARRLRYEGTVLLLVTITAEGNVKTIEITKSSGYGVLDKAAVRAVRKWKFESAKIGNKAVEATVEVPIRFQYEH